MSPPLDTQTSTDGRGGEERGSRRGNVGARLQGSAEEDGFARRRVKNVAPWRKTKGERLDRKWRVNRK